MNKSESIANLAKALSAAQGQMGGAHKGKANPFFKSVYADLSSVVAAIREPLSSNGLSFVQVIEPSGVDEVRVETVLMHESGEWVSGVTEIPVSKADAQGYGSAITYAKRYGLQAMIGVPSEDDDGNSAVKAKPESSKTVAQSAWESMDDGQKTALTDISMNAIALLTENRASDAVKYIDEQGLSTDEKAALWSRFDSKQRSAMKKAAQITPQEYAEQA